MKTQELQKLKVSNEKILVSKDWLLLALKRVSDIIEAVDVKQESIDLDRLDYLSQSTFICLTNCLEGKVNIDLMIN